MPSSQQVAVAVSKSVTTQTGWYAQSAEVNNQSNCWLIYKGTYVANPWQQCIISLPGDQAPQVTLTATSPSADQPNQLNPAGTCYIVYSSENQIANPGVLGANVPVIQTSQLLGTVTAAAGKTVAQSLTIPNSVHTIILISETSASDALTRTVTYTMRGNTTGAVYGSGTLNKGDIQDFPIDPAADGSMTLTLIASAGNTGVATILAMGSPMGTWPISVTLNAVTVTVPIDGTVLPKPTFVTDLSTTITAGNVSQTLVGFDATRHWIAVANPVTETENLGVNFTGGAAQLVAGAGSWIFPPGKGMAFPLDNTVSIIAFTTGHTVEAMVG